MKKEPLVSIIMPSFNSEKFIEYAIQSVLDQSYENWELLIIDDASTDNTLKIAKKFANEKIKILQNKINLGAAKSRNKGIQQARGEFIAFLDSDDIWLSHKTKIQIDWMMKNNISISCTSYFKINESSNRYQIISPPKEINYKRLLRSCPIGCLTVIYNANILGKVYMPENSKREDYATWLGLSKNKIPIIGTKEITAEYRTYQTQSSGKKIMMAKENWKIYRNEENLNFTTSAYYFIQYAFIGIWNKYKSKIIKLK